MRTRVRTPSVAAVVLLVTTALAGCSDTVDGYCSTLADEQQTLTDLADRTAEPGFDVLTPSLAALERLRDEAPDDLRDEWDTVVRAWAALADAVADAGVDPGDYRPGQVPEGLGRAERRQLAAVASKLSSPRVVGAAAGIEDHALEVCEVDFGA